LGKLILLRDLKGAMRLESSEDMPVIVSPCNSYDFNAFNDSFVEVVSLV
jgi:hypothetical protein